MLRKGVYCSVQLEITLLRNATNTVQFFYNLRRNVGWRAYKRFQTA
jgi:hypothetical protein